MTARISLCLFTFVSISCVTVECFRGLSSCSRCHFHTHVSYFIFPNGRFFDCYIRHEQTPSVRSDTHFIYCPRYLFLQRCPESSIRTLFLSSVFHYIHDSLLITDQMCQHGWKSRGNVANGVRGGQGQSGERQLLVGLEPGPVRVHVVVEVDDSTLTSMCSFPNNSAGSLF